MGKDDYPKSTFMESSYIWNSYYDFDRILGLTKLELKVLQCIDRSENKGDLMHSSTPIEIGVGVQ